MKIDAKSVKDFLAFRQFQEAAETEEVPAVETPPTVRSQPTAAQPMAEIRDPNADRFGAGVQFRDRIGSSEESEARLWSQVEKKHGPAMRHARIMRATVLANLNGGDCREGTMRVLQDVLGDAGTARYVEDLYVRNEASSQRPIDGGFLVPMETSESLIEFLYPYSVLGELGVTVYGSDAGNLAMNRQDTGATASYSFENAAPTGSDTPQFSQATWNTKQLVTQIVLPRQLLSRASYDADRIFRNDAGKAMGQKMELTMLIGAGQNGEIEGLATMAGLTAVTIGAKLDAKNIYKFKRALRKAFVPMPSGVRWLFNEDQEFALSQVTETDHGLVFQEGLDAGLLKKVPYALSQNIPTSVAGSKPSAIYYGDFSEYWVVREGAMQVEASNSAAYEVAGGTVKSSFSRHQVVIKMVDFHDMGPRDGRAICRCLDADTE